MLAHRVPCKLCSFDAPNVSMHRGLGLSVVKPWGPWSAPDRSGDPAVLGYSTHYELNFTYATVKGAGHMVPTFRPGAALLMVDRFLTNRRL
jgi:carboxypeptidase C (cathepsin A)